MMDEKNLDVKLALEEMRINLQQSLDAGDAIDQKLNSILMAAGLIIALVTTLQISLTSNRTNLYWTILLIALALYAFAIFLVMWGVAPKEYKLPIAPEWDEIDKSIFGKSEREAILTLLSGYVDQIQNNRNINRSKVRTFKLCLIILLFIVFLMSFLVAIE
jgi:hypothetical protein